MSSKGKITICIATKNRSDFLRRLLHYLANAEYQHWIFIGDSSDAWHLAETKEIIESLKDRLQVKHFECPGLSDMGATEHVNQFITTPYCAFLADDDFLCVNSINKCIDFLDSSPDYGAVHGTGIATTIDRSGPYGSINHVEYYPQTTLNAEFGSQRLRDFFIAGPYTLVCSVHRTRDWQEMYQGFISMPWARQGFIFSELIPSTTSAIRNKVKELDCLYLVRFGHDKIYAQVHVYDWFTSPDWFPGFKVWRDSAVFELMRQDEISKEAAEEVFKQAISPFLGRLFSRLLPPAQQPYKPGVLPRLMKIGRHIPGLKVAYNKIMPRFRAPNEANLLSSLLKPGSPYHQDFMPIYRAITNPVTTISEKG